MSKKGTGKLILGATIGAGLALLFAPKKGEELRKNLKNKLDDMLVKASNTTPEEVKNEIENKIAEIKKEIDELDKEKVQKIASEKAEKLKAKAEDLVEYAKAKGTPVLEKAANDAKKKAIKVCNEVITKLEEK